jgi:hypothetical protein
MTQHNDYDFFESEIQDIEEESIIQIEDNTIIQDVGGEENRIRDNNSNEDIGCIIETRNSHVKYDGDYAPYFPNATIFMLFTWCTKHMIGIVK